ncbi:MAG: hypothetical protein KME18_13040 [Phormidium tanganyikae FI6-MK23]|nr:hypothetical protein [Phormidium tanganyikae FI6-MK23]
MMVRLFMRDRSILASLLSLLITTSLPIVPAQAQINPSCSQQFAEDLVRRIPYPIQPLPAIVATNSVSRQFAELNEIAQSPSALDLIVQNNLDRWLIGRPFASRPDAPTPPQMDLLLKELSQPSEKAQLLSILDQLATRIDRLPETDLKYGLISGLARYYQQLGRTDRATIVLTRAIQTVLKQPNARYRASHLGGLLTTASELKQTPKIAPLLSQIETAIVSTMRPPNENITLFQVTVPLTLAQAYFETNQSAKALQIVDRVSKFAPSSQLNPDIARLYLQLKREDKAKPYLNTILRSPNYGDDERYLALAAVYDNPKLLTKAWEMIKNPPPEKGIALTAYFQAGGNPDRIAQILRSSSPELRVNYLLPVAGEYRKRNQAQKSSQAIEQFVQAVQQVQNGSTGFEQINQAVQQGDLPEANTAFRRLVNLTIITANPYGTIPLAQKLNALDVLAPTLKLFSNPDPDLREQVLQQFAIAYAQKDINKAISFAQQLPRQDSYGTRSPEIEVLTQIAAIQPQSAQAIFAIATKLAESMSTPNMRAVAYGAIARGYIRIGQEQAAETARQTAVKAAKTIQVRPDTGIAPNYVLALLSQQFLNENQIESAWKTFQELPKDAYKETNISNLVISAVQVGQLSIAQQAASLIDTYQSPDSYLSIVPGTAQAYLSRNRTSEAIALLDRAAVILNGKEVRSLDAHIQVIRLYAQVDRIDTARQLLAKYPEPGEAGKLRKQELTQYINCYAQRRSGARN